MPNATNPQRVIMAGLSLIHLGFLAATAAVAVPILIHLLLRPRARRVDIGSVRFLHRALRDSTRRKKVRRWLLLALRAAAVLLLALLFARPYLSGHGADGRDREVILLVDQSASTSAVQGGRTLFVRAQEEAAKVLKGQPENTAVHLAYFDAQGVAPVEIPRIDAARQPGFAGTDYNQALRWARDQVALSSRPRRTIYLFSDFQRAGLSGEPFDGLPPSVEVELVEIGRPLIRNLAIVQVEASQTVLRDKKPLVVRAQVRNAGPFPANNIAVRLTLDGPAPPHPALSPSKGERDRGEGVRQQVRTISVPAGAYQEAAFDVPIDKPGVYTGHVEIAGEDEFSADDRRWLALDARPPDRLLLLDGQPGVSVYGNQTYYLEMAMRLRLTDKDAPLTPYEPTRLPWGDGGKLPDLSPFRVVVPCNVAHFSDNDLAALRTFVSRGGALLVFTGDRVRPEGYVAVERAGLLPATVEGTAGPDSYRFGTWDRDHPIFRPLSDPQQGDLRRVAFHHVTRLRPSPDAKVLAAAQTGEPLVVEGRLGEGKILVVASAADRDWSDWPQSRLYVPLVHQLVGYFTDRLPETAHVQKVPADRDHPPGVTREGERVIVRNLDPAESEIERFSLEQFRHTFHLPESGSAKEKTATAAGTLFPEAQRPDEIWMYVVWILLLLLVAEIFVANRTPA
jgi:hypothetical protein